MTDPNTTPGLASEDSSGGAGPTVASTGRVRFPLGRWLLSPRTTWLARRIAADFGGGMDARTAWAMARLARHPDEHGYAMAHLNDERPPRLTEAEADQTPGEESPGQAVDAVCRLAAIGTPAEAVFRITRDVLGVPVTRLELPGWGQALARTSPAKACRADPTWRQS
ncbi:hypothetical protein [Streptomyces sp. NPDC050600]|uniref:hypothetical protein n=1 Tax=Streptomyces sp. NPDC050600 TaxID=3157213 RepID=UPI0034215589